MRSQAPLNVIFTDKRRWRNAVNHHHHTYIYIHNCMHTYMYTHILTWFMLPQLYHHITNAVLQKHHSKVWFFHEEYDFLYSTFPERYIHFIMQDNLTIQIICIVHTVLKMKIEANILYKHVRLYINVAYAIKGE